MPDVDFSQSVAEEEKEVEQRGFFNSGIVISLILLGVVAAGWGGLQFYMYTLDKKIAVLDAAISANTTQLEGEHIDRIADFNTRAASLNTDPMELVDPSPLLREIEAVMVPGVVLTGYKYDMNGRVATIDGQVEDFRKLAEQIMSLKSVQNFSQVKVASVAQDKDGKVTFSVIASFN